MVHCIEVQVGAVQCIAMQHPRSRGSGPAWDGTCPSSACISCMNYTLVAYATYCGMELKLPNRRCHRGEWPVDGCVIGERLES